MRNRSTFPAGERIRVPARGRSDAIVVHSCGSAPRSHIFALGGIENMTKTIATLFGAIYLIVGILGFIPQLGGSTVTTPSMLLGVASVNVWHNIVHLVIGLAGLSGGRGESGAIS